MSKTTYPPAKPVPPKFSTVTSFEWFRRFTLKERLFIAFGCNLNVTFRFFSVHRTGQWHATANGQISKRPTAKEHLENEESTLRMEEGKQ